MQRLIKIVILSLSLLMIMSPQSHASGNVVKIKAALIYQFAKYTHWPQDTDENITFCTIGQSPVNSALDNLVNRTVHQRRVKVVHLANIVQDIARCQVVFISATPELYTFELLAQIANLPILTISDTQYFTSQGGMISLIQKGLKQRFMINVDNTNTANLKLSSKLLRLAIN